MLSERPATAVDEAGKLERVQRFEGVVRVQNASLGTPIP